MLYQAIEMPAEPKLEPDLVVSQFGSLSKDALKQHYSLAISFTAACRRVLARAGMAEMVCNFTRDTGVINPSISQGTPIFPPFSNLTTLDDIGGPGPTLQTTMKHLSKELLLR